ncbi:hypothetical protein Glove_427g18 [Diversispora epigaea]|uniref:Uncharacterized protein n=1 Tax=Diversispora epigaea TaxID=1348612 RepID=A0A397GZI1_9GLOM|nr:hypothetical protein Glove_427g18 [Diversispora epigaea]
MREVAEYCIIDTISCPRLMVKHNAINEYREVSSVAFIALYNSHYFAVGMKVHNLLSASAWQEGTVTPLVNYNNVKGRRCNEKTDYVYKLTNQNRSNNDNSSWREFNYKNYSNRPRSRPRVYVNQRIRSPSLNVQQIHQEIRKNIPENSSFFTQSRQSYSLISTPSTSAGTSLQGSLPRNSGALTDITEELNEEITDTEAVENNWRRTHLTSFLQFNHEPLFRLPNNINPGENTPLRPIPEENPEQPENMATSLVLRPLKFTGNRFQNLRRWIKEFEKAARANTWRDKMEAFLYEDAEEWYAEANTQTYEGGNDEWPTWVEFTTAFERKFYN